MEIKDFLKRLNLSFGFCSERCKSGWAICLFSFPDFEFTDYECQLKVKLNIIMEFGYLMIRSGLIRPVAASKFKGSTPFFESCGL
jgi:hypothetical protein